MHPSHPPACRSYLHHLFKQNEPLFATLASIHNLKYMVSAARLLRMLAALVTSSQCAHAMQCSKAALMEETRKKIMRNEI